MELGPDVLQAYANEHCDGDRLRAVHRLLVTDEDMSQVDYLSAMNEQELDFALLSVEQLGLRAYGNKENYQKAVKINALQGQMGVRGIDPAKPNPFGKVILKDFLMLILAVAIPILIICLMQWPLDKLIFLVVLLALGCVLGLYVSIRTYCIYEKLRKLYLSGLPEKQNAGNPTFEECMQAVNANGWKTVFWEDAQQATARCKKRNWKELLMLPLFFLAMVLILAFLCQLGIAGAVVACLAIIALAAWRCSLLLREEKRAEDLIRYTLSSKSKQQLLKNLGKCSWGSYLLLFAYGLLTFAGCYAGFDLIK